MLAFGLLLLAVYLLAYTPYPWDGGLLFVLSLAFLERGEKRLSSLRPNIAWPHPRTLGDLLPWLSLLLSAIVGLNARNRPADADYTSALLLWLLALGLTGGMWLAQVVRVPQPMNRREWRSVGWLLLIAGLLRFISLGTIPANIGGDEGTQLLAGVKLLQRPLGNPFATGWYSVPTLSFLAYGATMRLMGVSIAGGRALSALVGTLTVGTTWLLGKALGGRRLAWLSALLVAFSAYHIHFSRLASNQIFDPLIGTLAAWLLWRAWKAPNGEQAPEWGLSGLVAGLGWYAYFGARWVTILIWLILLWRMLVEPRFWHRHRRDLLLWGQGWLIATLPLLFWYTAHPTALTERYNAVSIFASGWLTREMATTGKSMLTLLAQQSWRAISAFYVTPDPTFWYFPEVPLVDVITAALLAVGMLAAFRRRRWPSRGMILLWFWSTLTMAWILTENPPSSQRGLLLIPPVAILAAWGLETLWDSYPRYAPMWQVLVGLALLLNVGFYFGSYTPRRTYGNPTSEIATEYARYALSHPPAGMTYFYGAPRLYWDFGTLAFLLRDQPGMDVQPNATPEGVAPPARFVLFPWRSGELSRIKELYPDGTITRLKLPDGSPLAVVYDWP